jgi:hypothetical protein
MPSIGRAGRAGAGIGRSTLVLTLASAVLAIPATAAAAPVGSASVHPKRVSKRAGSAVAFKAVASATTSVNRLHVYLDPKSTATQIELGLYRGSSKPRTRIGACAIAAPRAGWNECAPAKAVRVTKGRTYWTAMLLPRGAQGVIRFRDKRRRGAKSYISSSSSLRSLPGSYRPGRRWRSVRSSIYADRSTDPSGASSSVADTDKDGVQNSSDQCPSQAGPASNHGCPVPVAGGPSRSSNCMPDPSACGFPDVETTGVPPGTPLTAASGTVTLSTPGQVYENKLLTGGIVVTAPNVTIRNVKIVSRNYQAISAGTGGANTTGLLIQDVEIDLGGNEDAYGIIESNYTAVRTLIHNGSDCAHLGTNATIRDSFCSVGPDTNNDGWADSTGFCSGPEHFDGYSSDGGANQVYDHNTIRNPCSQTSAILESTNSGAISNVTITNNLMAGGGYTLYCAATSGGVGGTEVVTGNRFARTYRPQSGYYGPVAYCNTADTFSGNVWDDTGQAINR